MPYRKVVFANGEFYHVFNRGVGKIPIFLNNREHKLFLQTMLYYQLEDPKPRFSRFHPTTDLVDFNKKIVEIVSYSLMPNHFHFLLRQERQNGIVDFLRKLCNSYARYFNLKNNRVGPLFQGEFKAVHIETDEQLLHLSRYIHLNPLVGFVTKDLDVYEWSSFREFVGISNKKFFFKDIVLSNFASPTDYKEFVMARADYGKQLELIKHQLLD